MHVTGAERALAAVSGAQRGDPCPLRLFLFGAAAPEMGNVVLS